MGSCCHGVIPKGTADEEFKNKKITKMMKAEHENEPYIHKILLLGPGDSGKTTILKQMRKIHGVGDIHDNAMVDNGFATVIMERLMGYMKILCEQSIALQSPSIEIEEKNHEIRNFFAYELQAPYANHFNDENCNKIRQLWADGGIRQTLKRRSEYQIPDNVEYFFGERFQDISKINEYEVTFEDFLRIRMRTTGFMSERFHKNIKDVEHQFVFTDVGGQRSERIKWMNMMHDDIDAVLYVVAISEYDLVCFEDSSTLRLDEALNLFKTVINNGFCSGKTVTLFFNKYDLFKQKLNDPQAKTIKDIYPDDWPEDKDERDCDDVCQYVYDEFLRIYEDAFPETRNAPHYHRTTALDTEQIDLLMQDIEGDLIRGRLIQVGF